ncbi:MAG: 16S rRNA (adenine(1518)-N(6)/adenine(1519)-N(6))-dimethyltransferase RsmA [Acidimicrobiia bacterium]
MTLLTPSRVRALLDEHDLAPSRGLGQHFLADPNTARRIVRLAGVAADDRVLEIGPGLGSLTLALLEAGGRVLALELDRHVVPALRAVVPVGSALDVVVGDALAEDLDGLLAAREPGTARWKLVANLPYNVATPLVVRVLETAPRVDELLVMVQREVGERLAAPVGTAAYGAVTVKVGYYGEAAVVGIVPPSVFVPPPKVESALVRVRRHRDPPVDVADPERLFALVRAGFAHRRKMLRQALRGLLGDRTVAVLEAAGIDPRARAETVTLDGWARLAGAVGEAGA